MSLVPDGSIDAAEFGRIAHKRIPQEGCPPPRFVDDGRTHPGDGRDGSERCSGRNPRSSVAAMATITGVGREAIRRLAQVTAMACSQPLSRAAQRRQIVAWRRQPQVTAMGIIGVDYWCQFFFRLKKN